MKTRDADNAKTDLMSSIPRAVQAAGNTGEFPEST
jgi:hypothetical protein